MEDKELEFLERERDYYYQGDWDSMLSSLKKMASSPSTPPEVKKIKQDSIARIEIHLGRRPKSGYRNIFGRCRIPADMSYEDFEKSLKCLEEVINSEGKDSGLTPAYLATKEILYLIRKNDLKESHKRNMHKPITLEDTFFKKNI